MFGVTLLMALMAMDGRLNMAESLALVTLMVFYTSFLVVQSRRETAANQAAAQASAQGIDDSRPSYTPRHRALGMPNCPGNWRSWLRV